MSPIMFLYPDICVEGYIVFVFWFVRSFVHSYLHFVKVLVKVSPLSRTPLKGMTKFWLKFLRWYISK